MAIQDNTPAFAAAGATAPAAQQPTSTAQQTPPGRVANPFSLLSMGNVGGLVRSSASEALAKGYVAVEAAIKESRISASYRVHGIQIDNAADRRLRLSSIVLAIRHESAGIVAHHTLILEASADPVPPKIEVINTVQVTIDRFAAQVYDDKYATAVDGAIKTLFPGQAIMNTGATVVPRIFDWSDKEATRELVQNAMMASVTYLECRLPGFADMDLSQMAADANLQVQVSYHNPQTIDYTGLPVRSDISILTSAVAAQRTDTGSLNDQAEAVTVARVTGFIDLTYVGNPQQAQVYGQVYGQPAPGAKRIYQPRFVITKLENMLRLTPAAQLLALATASTLGETTAWYANFRANQKAGPKDPHDIGAVNIEANLYSEPGPVGTKTDTKAANFTDADLGGLINATCHPGLAMSIDVNDCGSDTWYNRQLVAAAAGDAAANNEILRAANTLTGGQFALMYGNSNFAPVLKTDERVFMGFYIGADGHRTDVREVDYLTVLNKLAVKNPQVIVDWSDSYERTDLVQELRLQGRKTIIRSLCEQLTFTQYATRVTMNPAFMQMLVAALKQCKISFKLINAGMASDYMSSRGAGLMGQAAMLPGNSGLFNPGGFNSGGGVVGNVNRPYQGQSMV